MDGRCLATVPWPARSLHELVEQPARPDDLGIGRSDPLGQFPVGGDHDYLAVGLGDGGDRVVAIAGRMHNRDAVRDGLVDAEAVKSFNATPWDHNKQRAPSCLYRRLR